MFPPLLVRKFTNITDFTSHFFTHSAIPGVCICCARQSSQNKNVFDGQYPGDTETPGGNDLTCHLGSWLSPAHVWGWEEWALRAAGTGAPDTEHTCARLKTSPSLLCPTFPAYESPPASAAFFPICPVTWHSYKFQEIGPHIPGKPLKCWLAPCTLASSTVPLCIPPGPALSPSFSWLGSEMLQVLQFMVL